MTTRSKFSGEWPFEDEPRVAVFTTTHVVRSGKPILYVSHDADAGSWQFHSNEPVSMKYAMILALEEILEIDPGIASLANLPLGYCATRKIQTQFGKLNQRPIPEAASQQATAADGAKGCFSGTFCC